MCKFLHVRSICRFIVRRSQSYIVMIWLLISICTARLRIGVRAVWICFKLWIDLHVLFGANNSWITRFIDDRLIFDFHRMFSISSRQKRTVFSSINFTKFTNGRSVLRSNRACVRISTELLASSHMKLYKWWCVL